MLFAKISPQAQIINQITPFSSETTYCEYMGVIARPYVLGTEVVNFEIQYGNLVFDELLNPINYIYVKSYVITLSGDQLNNWGIDDRYIFEEIAGILGIQILNYVDFNAPWLT